MSQQTFPACRRSGRCSSRPPGSSRTLISAATGSPIGSRLAIRPDSVAGSLGSARFDDAVRDDARGFLEQGSIGIVRYGPHGERRGEDNAVFVASYAPRPRMIVFGAIDFAAAVARVGPFLGYRVTVCDARATLRHEGAVPDAYEVIVDWRHRYLATTQVDERTVVCVLTHDPIGSWPDRRRRIVSPWSRAGACRGSGLPRGA